MELFPTKSTTAIETASVILHHIGRFGSPEVIHTDQGPAFHNELVHELLRLCAIENSFATAYDSRVHDKWSFEQLPLVQRIMNTVEKTSTGITPADLILSHSIRLNLISCNLSVEVLIQVTLHFQIEWMNGSPDSTHY